MEATVQPVFTRVKSFSDISSDYLTVWNKFKMYSRRSRLLEKNSNLEPSTLKGFQNRPSELK